jgi:hypothetical protein
MSDAPQDPGWWQGGNDKWYSPNVFAGRHGESPPNRRIGWIVALALVVLCIVLIVVLSP